MQIFEKQKNTIWLMRQAGRYLPEYRAIRANFSNFLDLCYDLQAATEVTLQPIRRFDFDYAILFSDILVLPHLLGWGVKFAQGEGPLLRKFTSSQDMDYLKNQNFSENSAKVYEIISNIRAKLSSDKPLIGFVGSPWTVATYMIEGKGKQDFLLCKNMLKNNRKLLLELIDFLTEQTILHLSNQINAGANIVKLFDSWAGVLEGIDYIDMVVLPTQKIVKALKTNFPSIPIIGFPKGSGDNYEIYLQSVEVDVLAVDQFISVEKMAEWKKQVVLQGNLDPLLLLTQDKQELADAIDNILGSVGGNNFIFNLGHGIVPQTPIDNVEFLVNHVRKY